MTNSIAIIQEELERLSHDPSNENNILLINQIANLIANHHARIAFEPVKIKGIEYKASIKKYQIFKYRTEKINGVKKKMRRVVFQSDDIVKCVEFKNKMNYLK